MAGRGGAAMAWLGPAWRGKARRGSRGKARQGGAGPGPAWQSRHGGAWLGKGRRGGGGAAGGWRAGRGAAVVATKREGGDLPQLTKTRPPDAGFARFEIGSDSAQIALGKKNRSSWTTASAGLQTELGDQLVYSTFSYAK